MLDSRKGLCLHGSEKQVNSIYTRNDVDIVPYFCSSPNNSDMFCNPIIVCSII